MDKKICVIGGGRWGKNHIRTLAGLGCLAAVVEADAARLKEYTELYPGIKGYADMDEAIACGYDGYTVALPAELHYPAGRKLLEKGLNVMLEKPMTLTAAQSAELVELAQRTGARLMVGHVLLFHPAYRKIKEVIDSGRLGKLFLPLFQSAEPGYGAYGRKRVSLVRAPTTFRCWTTSRALRHAG